MLDDGRRLPSVPLSLLEHIPDATISDKQKLLDRVRKLHAKAESAKALGSEAEAASFAAAVSKMLAKYKLDMSELEFSQMEKAEPVGEGYVAGEGKRTRQLWAEVLAAVVADAHFWSHHGRAWE